ncbi:MAG TPA: hypothetical protein VHT75_04405 [Acidimicrobiales bacterium]|nr:hypothetical protein [Acidimicrobiales bacterium]
MADEPTISFTVSELLQQIKADQTAGFARMEVKLDNKADKADVASIQSDLAHYGERLGKVEDWRRTMEVSRETGREHAETAAVSSQRRWNVALGLTMALLTGALVLVAVLH